MPTTCRTVGEHERAEGCKLFRLRDEDGMATKQDRDAGGVGSTTSAHDVNEVEQRCKGSHEDD